MLKRHHTDTSIRTKLLISFTLIFIGLAIISWQGISGIKKINTSLTNEKDQIIAVQKAYQCHTAFIEWNRSILNHVLSRRADDMDKYEKKLNAQKEIVLGNFRALSDKNFLSDKEKRLFSKINEVFHQADVIGTQIVTLSQKLQKRESNTIIQTQLVSVVNKMDEIMTEFVQIQQKQLKNVMEVTDERYKQGLKYIIFVIAAVFVFFLLIAFYITRFILSNINELIRGAEIVSKGDLKNGKVAILSKDEFGYLGLIFNNILDALDRNIKERNKQRESFIAVLIHDLRAQLFPVIGFIKKLKEGKMESEKDTHEALAAVYELSDNLLKNINNLIISLKNKVSIQSSFKPKKVVFNDFIISIVENYLPEIDSRNIDISINDRKRDNWHSIDEFIISADPFHFTILIENLLKNTLKHAQKKINIVFYVTGNDICLVISDDAPKKTEEYYDAILEEYFYAPRIKDQIGIGFYSVNQIVANHDGKISISSSDDGGTRFELIFPGIEDDEDES